MRKSKKREKRSKVPAILIAGTFIVIAFIVISDSIKGIVKPQDNTAAITPKSESLPIVPQFEQTTHSLGPKEPFLEKSSTGKLIFIIDILCIFLYL